MSTLNPLDHPICLAQPARLAPSQWLEHAPLAMFLIDLIRPRTFVELGTHFGVSYCAFCQAVQVLGLQTRCFAVDTWTGDVQSYFYGPEVLADLREHHDPRYGGFSELLEMPFDAAAPRFAPGSIDLLHLDGCHTYAAVRHDFDTWLPRMSARGLMLFHDIGVRRPDFGVWRLWEELAATRQHFQVAHGHGLGLLAVGADFPPEVVPLFSLTADEHQLLEAFFLRLGQAARAQFQEQEAEYRADLERRRQQSVGRAPDEHLPTTSAGAGQRRAVILTGGVNHFFDAESRRLADALRALGVTADVTRLEQTPDGVYHWCFVNNPYEVAISTGDRRIGARRLAALRERCGQMFAVTMECLDSRWFPDVQAVTREAGIATLLDLGLFPQHLDTGRPLPEGYRFVFNGLTADEKGRVRVASTDRRPRPLPWAFIGLLTPARARLADALTREVSAGGFLYLPKSDEATVPGNFLNETALERVLRRSPYAIWCGQDEHFYLESQRFRQAVLAGAAPVKVLFGERPPAGAPFATALVPFDGLTERLAQTPAADLHRRAADEFCALPSLERSLAELLGLPMPDEEESDAHSR